MKSKAKKPARSAKQTRTYEIRATIITENEIRQGQVEDVLEEMIWNGGTIQRLSVKDTTRPLEETVANIKHNNRMYIEYSGEKFLPVFTSFAPGCRVFVPLVGAYEAVIILNPATNTMARFVKNDENGIPFLCEDVTGDAVLSEKVDPPTQTLSEIFDEEEARKKATAHRENDETL